MMASTNLHMVRNIDLPEAIVFYGLESIMEPPIKSENSNHVCDWKLRSGIARLLNECQEVGTAALLLSETVPPFVESIGDENYDHQLQSIFEDGWRQSFSKLKSQSPKDPSLSSFKNGNSNDITKEIISFRCPKSAFKTPITETSNGGDYYVEDTESYEFYNVGNNGRSPSPAFLMDSLNSIHIDPRGFGGSSGFGRGQWIEPRRSPMPARTVAFIAGDWELKGENEKILDGEEVLPTVQDRCAAARAAGCRIIYIEHSPDQPLENENVSIVDDTATMSLCDAVVTGYGSDNPRDMNPISLDAISTPGEYWLNPPNPRDDCGNALAVDEVVEWFRLQRELDDVVGDATCVVEGDSQDDIVAKEMSDEEIDSILADLDGL